MHIYFSGIGGAGISALASIAKQAGYEVSGSDARDSQYLDYLRKHGINDLHVGISREQIAAVHAKKPIDWYVYGSAQPMDFPDNPEFAFCKEMGIKMSKRDELLNKIIADKNLKLIAIAGTHGKTTTTAMAVWLFKQLNVPLSYSVGGKISFGDMGEFNPASQYFVYEADEFDRNFLAFHPELSIIAGIDWDHPDIYPSREDYYQAFRDFIGQSKSTVMWQEDAKRIDAPPKQTTILLDQDEPDIERKLIVMKGRINRLDAWITAHALHGILNVGLPELLSLITGFPGLSRRFEPIAHNLYSDYAHTPAKIRGVLGTAKEVFDETMHRDNTGLVVIYEGLHNTRQHFIKDDLAHLFDGVKQVYIVPTYLAREDPKLEVLTPDKLLNLLSNSQKAQAAELNDQLAAKIREHTAQGDLVLGLSAGGGGSLDEWLRKEFA